MIEARDGAGAPPYDADAERSVVEPAGSSPLEGRIREKARELWILEGRPNEDGHEQRHWDMARQLILQDQYIPMDARFEAHTRPADIGKHS